jgi:hypothetical protein
MAQAASYLPSTLFSDNAPASSNIPTAATTLTSASASSSNTFLMSASPIRNRKAATDSYRPKIISTIGAKPACLVNASVTYVGNDQIYAFGGFDQYTDEGRLAKILSAIEKVWADPKDSLQPCTPTKSCFTSVELGRQLWRHSGRTDG